MDCCYGSNGYYFNWEEMRVHADIFYLVQAAPVQQMLTATEWSRAKLHCSQTLICFEVHI